MICVYEDEGFRRLSPLVDLRPVFDLRCGRFTLLEKLQRLYPNQKFNLWVRDELAELTAEVHPGYRVNQPVKRGGLFLSGRAILEAHIESEGREAVLLSGDDVVGFRFCAEHAVRISSLEGLKAAFAKEQVKAKVVKWPWDIVEYNAEEIEKELKKQRQKSGVRNQSGVVLVGPRNRLIIAPGARVWPGTVINTETGSVMVDRNAQVRPGSFIEGPCYIGPGTVIDAARVRPGCSFGPHCRVGGEVEASVFQGYANKHHDGFIGHSFVGEWANLGALTTNSDLKNAYQPVRVFFDGKAVDTGLLKVGCFIGDHAKTAIGTLLNTGARVGTFANWFEPGLSPREIPAFAWGQEQRWKLSDALVCAQAVMARRGIRMTSAYERVLRRLHGR